MGKGQAKILEYIFIGVIVMTAIAVLVFFVTGRYFDIKGTVQEDERDRHALTLGQVLLSSQQLAYEDENKIYRAIFDEQKIESISQNPDALFSEYSYDKSRYFLIIEDGENGKKWTIGSQIKIFKSFPVAIRYSDSEIHVGLMSLGYEEDLS